MGIPFSPSLPDITKCQSIRAYRIGNYMALIVRNPKSMAEGQGIGIGIIEYLYAMAVSQLDPPHELVLMVTAERNGENLRAMLKESNADVLQNLSECEGDEQLRAMFDASSRQIRTNDPFLCVFDSMGGHGNFGPSSELTNIDVFSTRALEVVRNYLHVEDKPVELHQGPQPQNQKEKGGCLSVVLLVLIPAALLFFL